MRVLAANEVEELRALADRAKLEGQFDDGELLHTLLDDHATVERALAEYESLDELKAAADKGGELESQVEDLEETVEDLKAALGGSADYLEQDIESLEPLLDELDERIKRGSATEEELKDLRSHARALKRELEDAAKRLREAAK